MGRLHLVIDPKLHLSGDLEKELLDRLATEIRGGALTAEIWSQVGTLSIVRKPPRLSGAGKVHPLLTLAEGEDQR